MPPTSSPRWALYITCHTRLVVLKWEVFLEYLEHIFHKLQPRFLLEKCHVLLVAVDVSTLRLFFWMSGVTQKCYRSDSG